MYTRLIRYYALTVFVALYGIHNLRAQSTQEVFGKNRVQYKPFAWKQITTTNFDIYFYQDGNESAYQAARYAESDFDRIADLLGYTPYSKTKIFVYNSNADLQQSNVGISNDDVLIGGQANFIKSQVEIAFTGNQVTFKRELSRSIAQVFISEMMFGGSLKDMLQSSLLLSLPDWYMTGAAAYVANGWSVEMDDYMRDAVLNANIRKPSVITGDRAALVGQSIWNYIAERYGKGNISNILNLTRIIRNEETSISSTIGIPYNRFLKDWKQYYIDMASQTAGSYAVPKETTRPRKVNRRGFIYNQVAISPDGKYLAYSENLKGVYTVKLINTDNKKKITLLRDGYRVINQRIDKQIPLLSWQSNRSLAIITIDQARTKLSVYEIGKRIRRKSKRNLDQFNQVLDFDISDDGTTMALSADKGGQSDIFLIGLARNATRQLTNDLFDDLNPHFLTGSSNSVVFSSNRQNDSLNVGKKDYRAIEDHFNLFLHDGAAGAPLLQQLTKSLGNATQPIVADNNTLFYLNDEKGIRNLYRFDLANRTTIQVSSFRQNIRSYDINYANQSIAYHTLFDSREYVGLIKPFDFGKAVNPLFTKRNELQEETSIRIQSDQGNSANKPGDVTENIARNDAGKKAPRTDLKPGEIDTDNYQFDSDIVKQEEKPAVTKPKGNILTNNAKNARKEGVAIKGPFAYQSRFSANNVRSTLVINPITGWGINFDANMNDMLEDHIVKMGGVLNTDLRSNNFFGEYRYLRSRIDYGLRIDRKQIFINDENATQKYRLNQVMLSASYPFSVSSRITVAPFYTSTRYVELPLPVSTTDLVTNYGGLRVEYVFDNTLVNGMNMIEGTRMKVKYENYQGINASYASFNSINVDIRNYKKIHRDLIFATRLAFGHFGGRARKKFLLGGMDNWLFNSRENPLPPDAGPTASIDKRDYYFLPFATNLRGFNYNKLAGYNYLLFNAELRLPLIKYFYRGPITSNFLRNLQLVAFTDIGTAWNQQSPFSRQNDLNTEIKDSESGPFRATVVNFKNPFLTGYGVGIRTFLLGYYVKFDTAWGVENYTVGPARFYLTLGYDF